MSYASLEVITSFIIGIILILISCFIFKLKIKGIMRLLINAVLGGIILLVCHLCGVVTLPLNPLNALTAGFFGVFGVIFIYLLVTFG